MYETKVRIPYNDIGTDAYMTETGIINEFQNCCTFQCEDIGYGLRYLSERKIGWFVISWQVHIYERPYYGEEITVITLPHLLKGPFGYRNFVMKNRDGKVLAEANSIWILMNLLDVTPVKVPEDMKAAFGLDEPLPIKWPNRKIKPDENREMVYEFEVSPMHVDTNGHMNNTYYIDGARGALPKGFSTKEMYVEYKRQAKLGDRILVSLSHLENGFQVVLEDETGEPYAAVNFL